MKGFTARTTSVHRALSEPGPEPSPKGSYHEDLNEEGREAEREEGAREEGGKRKEGGREEIQGLLATVSDPEWSLGFLKAQWEVPVVLAC